MSSQPSEPQPSDKIKLKKKVNLLLVGLPFLIALVTLGGTLLGLYLRDMLKTGGFLFPLLFSMLGLGISIYLSYVITNRVASKQ